MYIYNKYLYLYIEAESKNLNQVINSKFINQMWEDYVVGMIAYFMKTHMYKDTPLYLSVWITFLVTFKFG